MAIKRLISASVSGYSVTKLPCPCVRLYAPSGVICFSPLVGPEVTSVPSLSLVCGGSIFIEVLLLQSKYSKLKV